MSGRSYRAYVTDHSPNIDIISLSADALTGADGLKFVTTSPTAEGDLKTGTDSPTAEGGLEPGTDSPVVEEGLAEARSMLQDSMAKKRLLIVDLSQVAIVDGAMVAVLLGIHQGLCEKDGRLIIVAPGKLAELLKVSRLHKAVDIEETLGAAKENAEQPVPCVVQGMPETGDTARRLGPESRGHHAPVER